MELTSNNSQEPNNKSITGLLAWLLLVPVVLSSLVCFGQLALILNTGLPSAITRSLLKADYGLWPYDEISPINLAAFLEDVRREQRLYGTGEPLEVVQGGVFWVPPTPTLGSIAQITATSVPQATETGTVMVTPSLTSTLAPSPSATAIPTTTPLPTRTSTFPPPRPSPTYTRESSDPPPDPTKTPVTPTAVPPTATFTPPPTNTFTPLPTATFTPVTPEPPDEPIVSPPTYAPVRPIAEDGGVSEPFQGGCRAYFGYRNANPQDIDIPAGKPNNYFSIGDIVVEPSQPERFFVGRVVGAFYVVWQTSGPITWYLEGAEAVAEWCNP
jgi:hypothetical protein